MTYNILFIGEDRRLVYAAEQLGRDHSCTFYSGGAGNKAYDIAVLPIITDEASAERYAGIVRTELKEGGMVFGGRIPEGLFTGYEVYDYLEREELAVLNAELTAEGAVAVAVNETLFSISGASVLVLGYGRIGKLTARYFSALGSAVYAAARKPADLAWIKANGQIPVDFGDEAALRTALSQADIILNTVPARIMSGDRADKIKKDALLIELASVSCTDENAGVRVIKAGGLPGKTAPASAGRIVAETIENILHERSIRNGGAQR